MTGEMTDSMNRRLTAVEYDTTRLKEVVESIATSQSSISESLQRLALLWERHEDTREATKRIFDKLDVIDKRISDVEKIIPSDANKRLMDLELKVPQLVETRGWVVGIIASMVAGAATFVLAKFGIGGK